MSTRVDELVRAIRALSDEERAELWAQVEPAFWPMDKLRARYDGKWVALEIPEGEDAQDPQRARLLACAETDEAAYDMGRETGYEGVITVVYFGEDVDVYGPLFYLGDEHEI